MKLSKKERDKAFKAFVKKVERSNEKFKKAKPHEKIVMVAEDVLSMLKLKRIVPRSGTYFSVEIDRYNHQSFRNEVKPELGIEKGMQVSDILKLPNLPACDVCAIGGAMMACTLRLNKVKLAHPEEGMSAWYDDNSDPLDSGMTARAKDVFPNELLRTMEEAFEDGDHGYGNISIEEDAYTGRGITKRLKAIYQNLLDNEGKCFTHYKSKEVAWPQPVTLDDGEE